MNEQKVTEVKVRNEHMQSVSAPAHWAYLIGVIAGSFLLMICLIAMLGST